MNEEISVPFKTMGSNPELSLIGKSIANMDEMVRRVNALTQENQRIKQKYKSLNHSAKMVKELYEKERSNCFKMTNENMQFRTTISSLRERNQVLEHAHVNMKLSHAQIIADIEAKTRKENEKCNSILTELILQCQDLSIDTKLRAVLKQVADLLINKGVDINKEKIFNKMKKLRRKRKETDINAVAEDTMSIDSETSHSFDNDADLEENTISSIPSVKFVPILPTEIEESTPLIQSSTCKCLTESRETPIEKTFSSTGTNTILKTFSDKSTTYSISTITRGTNTVVETSDFGMNFPEYHSLPSIQHIFEEMIVEIPALLSPISDPPNKGTSTQTESAIQTEHKSTTTRSLKTKTIGTNTNIKNIRKPIEYSSNPCYRIKKEESYPSFQPESELNPQLTHLWALLGQMIFQLIGNGQVFDNSQLNTGQAWEQIRRIQQMIEIEGSDGVMDFGTHLLAPGALELSKFRNFNKEVQCFRNFQDANVEDNLGIEPIQEQIALRTDDITMCDRAVLTSDVIDQENELNNDVPEDFPPTDILIEKSPTPSCSKHVEPSPAKSSAAITISKELSVPEEQSILPLVSASNETATMLSPIKNRSSLPDEKTPPRSTKTCQEILNSYKKLYLLSPIKDTPKQNEPLVTLMDLSEDEVDDLQNIETSEHQALIASILTEDSPQSPSEEIGKSENNELNIKEIPLETKENSIDFLEIDCPRSPISESFVEIPPKSIPLNRISNNQMTRMIGDKSHVPSTSVLNSIVNEYDQNQRNNILNNTHGAKESPKSSRDIELMRRIINNYLQSEWTPVNTKMACMKCMKYSMKQKLIITAFIETIEDNADESVNMENTPPAPPLPKTHQKLVLLVHKLNIQMPGIAQDVVKGLERKIFTLKGADVGYNLDVLLSLVNFYIGLTDVESTTEMKSKTRLFIFKALYYFNHKSFPLIYAILAARPSCLPKSTDVAYKNDDPLVTTIKCILMNSSKEKLERTEYRKRDLRAMLIKQYGYKPFTPTVDDVIKHLIQRLESNQLKNLDYSLILLSKRYGYEWAVTTIIKPHLYPKLDQLMAASMNTDLHDEKIILCIRTVSSILKTYSLNADITYFMQLFTQIFERSNKQIIQEAAIEGLLRFQRFGFIDIYQRISRWNPQYQVSDKLKAMLKTFVHRKDVRFWVNLSRQVR